MGSAGAPPRLNATAASLLGFLHDGPMTGWELVRVAMDRIGDFWSLTRSQVYRELAAMEAGGLIAAGERGPRDRRPYGLTDAGRHAFAAWAAVEPGDETIRMPILLMVSFGRHVTPHRLAAHLEAHRAAHAARLDRYEAFARAADAETRDPDPEAGDDAPYRRATLEFGLAYERAVLAWFDRLDEVLPGRPNPD